MVALRLMVASNTCICLVYLKVLLAFVSLSISLKIASEGSDNICKGACIILVKGTQLIRRSATTTGLIIGSTLHSAAPLCILKPITARYISIPIPAIAFPTFSTSLALPSICISNFVKAFINHSSKSPLPFMYWTVCPPCWVVIVCACPCPLIREGNRNKPKQIMIISSLIFI